MDKEALYLRLPISLQQLALGIEGRKIQRTRYGPEFRRVLAELESRTFWTDEQVDDLRDERIARFVQHAVTTVPFYRETSKQWQIKPGEVRGLADLAALPVLTKAEVQDNYEALNSSAVPQERKVIAHTSGTTGGGLRFATTQDALIEQWATWWRYRRWHGIEVGTWCGYFAGRQVVQVKQSRPPYWRRNPPMSQILFSAYHINQASLPLYIEELRRRRPPWIHGYPSIIAMLAAHLCERGESLGYPLRWVTLGAENVLPQQAEVIRRGFGVTPLQHYGQAEAIGNASECPNRRLHVDEDFAAFELVHDDAIGMERIVGTNLSNPAVPLLRYDVGDYATLASERCDCGRPGRTLGDLDGRLEDYVVLADGRKIGRMDHVFKDLVRIREAQIYQDTPGVIVVRVVASSAFTNDDETSLLAEMRKRVGEEADIRFEYVESLPRGGTGKLRFVHSDIPAGHLASH